MRPTEQNNSLSLDIDVKTPSEMVQIMGRVDSELFSSWPGCEEFTFEKMIPIIEQLVDIIASSIDQKKKVILGGCGTSGRLGFFCSRQFNRILTKFGLFGVFDYSLAGDDEAIFVSNEIVEDSPQMGSDDLIKYINQHNGLGAYIGITCGLSAPYVAGQLETAMEKGLNTILLGHNPPLESKNTKIEKWDKTFRDVVKQLMEYENGLLITPVFGGECISGSSRMKGGSGTFITLMTAFIGALSKKVDENLDIAVILDNFKFSISHLYENNAESLAKLIQTEADSLKKNGHVRYYGYDDCGVLSLVDSSECPPTFGAHFDDIRGFILDGWQDMDNRKGELEMTHEQLEITLEDGFNKKQGGDNLHLILLLNDESKQQLENRITRRRRDLEGKTVALTICNQPNDEFDDNIFFKLIGNDQAITLTKNDQLNTVITRCAQNLQTKLILNTCSTGSHILKGKIAKNRMIDVKLTNSKLIDRGTLIVKDFCNCDYDKAREAILKSIHSTDSVTDEVKSKNESFHISKATNMKLVVPRAILLASGKANTISNANQILETEPIVRRAISV